MMVTNSDRLKQQMSASKSGWPVVYYQDAKLVLKAYTLRKWRGSFDWISGVTQTLIKVSAVHTLRQVVTARRLTLEPRLQRNGLRTITQVPKVLSIFPGTTAHN